MAFSKKKYGKAVKKLIEQLPVIGNEVIFRDVFEILDTNVADKYYMAQGYLDTLKRHRERNKKKGNGFGYCVVNQTGEEHPISYTILATGGSGKERNLIYQPKDGVSGKRIIGKKTGLNSEGIRVMTPNEWGRLQGFVGYAFLDDDGEETFSFPEGMTDGQKYKQLGNSVSIPVIKVMAEFMLHCFAILEKQQIEVVRALAENNEFFTKRDVMELLDLNAAQAGVLLRRMIESQELIRISSGKTTRFVRYQEELKLTPYSQEEKVLSAAKNDSPITNVDVQRLLNISPGCANVLLSSMVKKGLLHRVSRGHYIL